LEALRIARHDPPYYSSCIVDEIQDFTLAKLQLVAAVVSEPEEDIPPDGLTLLGDEAQRLYPGGCTLSNAGIVIHRHLSKKLSRNYRNSQEILDAAWAVAGDDLVESLDSDGSVERQAVKSIGAPRIGRKPRLVACPTEQSQDDTLLKIVEELCENDIQIGDIAVLCISADQSKHFGRVLRDSGIAVLPLYNYKGQQKAAIKVGTHRNSRSLEFKAVILPDISENVLPRSREMTGHGEKEHEEDLLAAKSHLYVAMTRARERLDLLYVDEPSEFLWDYLDLFNRGRRSLGGK
jgi:superfamily I DNA/RNA helicase